MSSEKKPRRPVTTDWVLPLFFVLIGTWYVAEWAAAPPRTPTFRFGLGLVLLLYGLGRLISRWGLPRRGS